MMVWAEIPDKEKYPELNVKVLKHMIHGPCGDPSQKYPCLIVSRVLFNLFRIIASPCEFYC